MDHVWFLVSFFSFICIVSAQLPHVKCRVKHKKIGCFHRPSSMKLLFTDRLLSDKDNRGHEIDWYNWDKYLHSLACRCNEAALSDGHNYFILHYYGLCYGSKDFPIARRQSSAACVGYGYEKCITVSHTECVGNDRSFYVYETGRDGGYGKWGEFSPCSQTCDVGVKKRTRNCTNPVPTGLGRNCSYVGPKLDTASCNLIYCRDINECESNPCRNGGVCIDQLNQYTCSCPGGYTGTHCEIDIDECASSPCLNGGACANRINHYTCCCPGGYTGTRCEIDVNECATNPCSYGETCYNNIGSYRCACHGSYRNGWCDYINECASNPCRNGGTCIDQLNRYTCSCPGGYTGIHCERVPYG